VTGAVAALAAAVATVVLLRGGDGDDGRDDERNAEQGGGYEPQIREELLDRVRSSPNCPDAAEAPAPAAGEVVVNVVRVVDGCLAFGSEAVARARVDDRLRELRAEPDVVAADRAVVRTPGEATGLTGGTSGTGPTAGTGPTGPTGAPAGRATSRPSSGRSRPTTSTGRGCASCGPATSTRCASP
jgi:hypothetical protein